MAQIDYGNADQDSIVDRDTVVTVLGIDGDGPEIGTGAPLCALGGAEAPGSTQNDYFAVRSGVATFYFIQENGSIDVVKLTVLATPGPSKVPAVILLVAASVLGAAFLLALIVHRDRRRRASEVSIRRADDHRW